VVTPTVAETVRSGKDMREFRPVFLRRSVRSHLKKSIVSKNFLSINISFASIVLVVNENVSLVISRQILSDVSTQLLPDLPDAQSKLLAHFTLEKVRRFPKLFITK